jgi:hypothetical protein
MRSHDQPDDLTPDERFQNIAILLATGLWRLRPRTPSSADFSQQAVAKKPPELSPNCLEFSAETRLSGHAG